MTTRSAHPQGWRDGIGRFQNPNPLAWRACAALVLAGTWLGAGNALEAAAPSASKLSVHLIQNYSAGTRQMIEAHPPVIKILDTWGALLQAARDYKAGTPDGLVILRIYTPRTWSQADDPAAAGTNYWQTVLAPGLNGLSAADRALIDYVEGPNEGDSTPTWGSLEEAAWYNTFWLHLAQQIGNAGFRPLAYSISVGNPPGDSAQVQALLDRIVPSLRVIQSLGGGWGYHGYSLLYSTNLADEIWHSLRYRQYYDYFAGRHPDLAALPLVLTEGGIDGAGPWSTRGDAAKFQDWLAWFDQELRQDRYCLGVTLFQIGDTGGWGGFNVEPVAGWISQQLNVSARSNAIPSAPGVLSAIAGDKQVTLRWTGRAVASRYVVKHGLAPEGPFTILASNLLTLHYASLGLSNGTVYYFTVSAVNSAGESSNAIPVAATPQSLAVATSTPPAWDARLTTLGVYYLETNVAAGTYYWKLVSGQYENETESGGNHNIYYKTLDAMGNPVANQRCWAAYPTAAPATRVELFTKAAVDGYWGNYAMSGGNWCPYYPTGPHGPYGGYVDGISDQVWGMGMPCNLHVNYRYIWQWTQKSGAATNTPWLAQDGAALSVVMAQGQAPPSHSLALRNGGSGSLGYALTDDAAWLSKTPASGTLSNQTDLITLWFNTNVLALTAGTYSATLTLTASNAANVPRNLPVSLTVLSTNLATHTVLGQDFETLPDWDSTWDASWGGAATWTIVAGGVSGNALQAARANTGSSAQVLQFNVVPNTTYRLSLYLRCPGASGNYWAESAWKPGRWEAQDFDANPGSWTLLQKFANPGVNGNTNVWTLYQVNLNPGTNQWISVGFKLGLSSGAAPVLQWDLLRLEPLPLPGLLSASLSGSNAVLVRFADPPRADTATNVANYSLLNAQGVSVGVRAAALQDQTNVVLTVNPLVARSNYLVRVVNVAAGSVTGIVQGVNGQTPLLAPHKLVVMDNVTAWRYHDGGANQGTAWRAPDFDDGSWPSGPAVLGFEDQPLPEPLRTVLRLETGKITYYFRTWFHWPYPNATAWLRLRQIIDDGVVFYMNGVELCRTRMTNQVVAFTNLAERTVTDAACEGPFDFWVTNLVSGANVLAAEVHQAAPTSGDVVFGASLEALVLPSELPWTRLSWGRTAAPGLYQMSWLGAGYRLETAPHFDGPWTLLPPQAPMIYFRPTNTARFHRLSQGP